MATAQLGAVLRNIRDLTARHKASDQTDGALLRAFLSRNDEAAFEALLQRHGPMVLQACRRTLGNVHDAEDALQATFLVLAQQAASIRKLESLASWLHGVAYRMATHAKRAAARRHKHEAQASPTQPRDPALCAAWQELQALLDEEIAGLPESLRAPFVYCCLENKSCAEAAPQLGLQESTFRVRLSRARKLLQERLTRRGVSLTAVLAAAAVGLKGASAAVPRSLVGTTAKAAAQLVAGQALASGQVSAKVITHVEGVNQTMRLTKCKTAILLLLCTAIVGAGVGLAARQCPSAEPPPGAQKPPQAAASEQPNDEPKPPAGEPAKAEAKDVVQVRGQVLDPEGKPVAGAKLYLGYTGLKDMKYPVRATSGDDGRFKFTVEKSELDGIDSDDRTIQVMAVAEGHGCDWAAVGPAGEEVTLRLVKDVPISMRVLDPEGKPVAGAKLTLTSVQAPKGEDLGGYIEEARKSGGWVIGMYWSGPLPGQPAVLTTDKDGRFKLAGAGRERVVHLRIEGPGIALSGFHVMTRDAESVKHPKQGWTHTYGASSDYVAHASRPIRGVVRDKETNKPLAGVSVEHYHGQGPSALTDKEGHYELLGLAKTQQYALNVKPPDGLYFQRRVVVEDTPGLGAIIYDTELVRGLTVRGRVTDKETGKPVAGAKVNYHPLGGNIYVDKLLAGSWDPRSEATTGADGSYALTVMPGPGAIGVKAPRLAAYMPAAVPRKERKDFFKTPLVEDRDEEYLTRYAGSGSWGSIGLDFYNAMVLLEPGEKEEGLVRDIALEKPQERRGRVVGPDDQPLAGVRVCGLERHGIETLKGDEFTVRGINPKAKRPLVFYHKDKNLGFYLKDLRENPEEPLVIKLQPCGSASGRVLDRDGQPVAGLRVHVRGRALRILGEAGGGWQTLTTDKDGRFRAEGLVPGQEYVVEEWDKTPSLPRIYAPVVVEPGKHKDMGDIKMYDRDE